MRNIKLILEYDGTDFLGWQLQPKGRTVQGVLQGAIYELMQEKPTIYAAGRTDAGVHALGQVVNFKTNKLLELKSIKLGLNSYLPGDVVVVQVEEVDESFHARYNARKRQYRYVISKRPRAVGRQYSWHCKYPLDVEQMRKASAYLIGEHVFKAFCKEMEDEPHYLCNVESINWQETADEIILQICANRFLHNMVRIILGTLVDVGRKKIEPEIVKQMIDNQTRGKIGFTAPPQGLFLEKVFY